MIYPQNFEQKVGFNQIKDLIRKNCISSMGEKYVDKIRFSTRVDVIKKLLDQVSEFKNILIAEKPFPAQDYFDLRDELSVLKTPGSYIEQHVLFDLRLSLLTVREIFDFFKNSEKEAYPELKSLVEQIEFPGELLPEADKIIDAKGEIKSTASEKLKEIRSAIEAKQRQVVKVTNKAFQLAKKSGWIPENAEITIRNGRAVVPLNASNKRSLGGFIQDESSTGQTVFIEPEGSFELNNQIRELENEERREIIKILVLFTDKLRPYILDLNGAFRLLGLIDFIRAKALFSQSLDSEQPTFSEAKNLVLKQAMHPLLLLAHEKSNKEVIPLDLELDYSHRILVISGPNAGGKSVCLKTIGLLQYMLQCGLEIPCSPDSKLPVFENLFIDIGDEQSLENDLSTYSSHLLNMKFFLRKANENTLFLIDEFGTGTEPQLGGAIAESVLEKLNDKKAFGVVTTHYTNLKLVAQRTSGMINGAMLFNSKEMQPLYQLQIGNPGSSFAFEIARKIGFPENVLKKAKHKSGGKHVSFDQQLQQLEIDKLSLEKKEKKLQSMDEQLSEMVEKYSNLLEDVRRNKKHIIDKAKQEALDIVSSSNKAVEKTIKEIKEVSADKLKTKVIRKKLDDKKDKLKKEISQKKNNKEVETENEELTGTVKIGDIVEVKNTDIVGELLLIEGKDAFLDVNDVRLRTSLSKLVKTKKKLYKKSSFRMKSAHQSIMNDINKKAANFSLSLDLRGERAEPALTTLRKYIDDAILLSIGEVSILHGKGDGILRPLIREYLETVEEVKNFGDAPVEFGGAGITKVFFR